MKPIVTLTMNPAVDKSAAVDHVVPDTKLRCRDVRHDPGGGGLNVARAVRYLGGEAHACWTSGGHTGALLGELLDREQVPHTALPVREYTRENLVVTDDSGAQFRFGMPGATLTEAEGQRCLETVTALARDAWLVLSGSLPPGLPADYYARVARAAAADARIILDTSGEALRCGLEGGGLFLVKPNLRELSQLAGEPLEGERAIEAAARRIVSAGQARWVAVSLGRVGAVLVGEAGCTFVRAPLVPLVSKVGAGDSMVAGMVLALSRGLDPTVAIRHSVAAGAAAAMTPGTELCRREDAERLLEQMRAADWGSTG